MMPILWPRGLRLSEVQKRAREHIMIKGWGRPGHKLCLVLLPLVMCVRGSARSLLCRDFSKMPALIMGLGRVIKGSGSL